MRRFNQFTPLTSSHNPLLKKVRQAVESGRPLEDGTIAAEGPHLVAEALSSAWPVEQIIFSSESAGRQQDLLAAGARRNIPLTEIGERAFKTVSNTEQDQGILCLVRPKIFEWNDLLGKGGGPLVILDGIQDPGNAGAIVRSAEAFGGVGVVLTEGCVRISNGKFLRAAAGSVFRVPYLESVARAEILREIRSAKLPFFALAADGGQSLFETSLNESFALAVGSEGNGVSEMILGASRPLSIPTRRVESLNAAIACSVALFEAVRQRELA